MERSTRQGAAMVEEILVAIESLTRQTARATLGPRAATRRLPPP